MLLADRYALSRDVDMLFTAVHTFAFPVSFLKSELGTRTNLSLTRRHFAGRVLRQHRRVRQSASVPKSRVL